MKYLELTVGAVLVYNFVLSRFLGICPFLGVSKRLSTAMGMSGAVIFVMTLASFITTLLYRNVLQFSFGGEKIDLIFLQVLVFILVIAALVQLIEIMLQKLSPVLYQALGIYLPLITTNCAVLGAATISANNGYTVMESTVFGFFSGVGFALALLLFASLRERLELATPPEAFKGTPIALVTAGILAMAFVGFSGLC
ncbi:electron transport complex protein RnfA [Victivallis vadensis]|uniref:Ion-translocating oxidoreductase complex subunit A n=1 Tax=Victivallis vadensis TaxID=172901 RepID=A0A2U1B7I2_9BACT|nr:RnfABCDGE type electron transport complex subunit A [Victivallis vadensis]NMD86168.1 RnfABCDGE type electron transport complex subunit A [Victivallis vadensis]PVY44588.1 electron transport complex protein RnfA [Victivallis vadensis]PWM80164.1 MAG: electron transport complex subunit RsxA [Lentisphaerota bacterium]HJH04843.1 RnfABCDGE type electron transport complex subunit A [Victivallis vadensis]